MTEPNYWDNKLYIIRGDAIELKRHVLSLADDLTFCTGHNAVRALEKFDEKARKIYGGFGRAGQASMKATVRQVRLRPLLSELAFCALGIVLARAALRSR